MKNIYILNTPILTDWGKYDFRKIMLPEVKELFVNNGFISAAGHQATADLLTRIIGITIPMNRVAISMKKGDIHNQNQAP